MEKYFERKNKQPTKQTNYTINVPIITSKKKQPTESIAWGMRGCPRNYITFLSMVLSRSSSYTSVPEGLYDFMGVYCFLAGVFADVVFVCSK